MIKSPQRAISPVKRSALRVGYVPLTDSAPLLMAQELGLFGKYGLSVILSRELGWATIRDKLVYRELDAAQAVVGMPFATTLGLGSIACECQTALVLNLHGNAITLSNELWKRGVRDGASLREFIRNTRRERTLIFGAVFSFSSHRHLLRKWLASHGIDPERDIRIVTVPPPQMAGNLKAGTLDGFCSGEPWNSVAVESQAGWCVATSAELDPGHPEKVLMVRTEFAERHSDEHLALVGALLEACRFCAQPGNHERVLAVLSRHEILGVPVEILRRALNGCIHTNRDESRTIKDFLVFHSETANEPSGDKAAWAIDVVRASGLCRTPASLNTALARRVFRADSYERAHALFFETNNLTPNNDHELLTV